MPRDLIRYDLRVQDALRGAVRQVLAEVARDGIPGDHHFYITFRTDAPGVRISNALRSKWPAEMTIVLQHHFWDLTVSEQGFEVGLSFDNVPEKLVLPFSALVGFYDPSVNFGLKFEVDDRTPPVVVSPEPRVAALEKRGATRGAGSEPAETPPTRAKSSEEPAKAKPAAPTDAEAAPVKVISLDAFRKKP